MDESAWFETTTRKERPGSGYAEKSEGKVYVYADPLTVMIRQACEGR